MGMEDHPAIQPGVDPSRAFLPLSQIEPPVSAPRRPADLKPLSDRSMRQIAAARSLIAEQRYTEASFELEKALRYDPNHPEVHRTLAVLHWRAGNIERARQHVRQCLDGNPDDALAHYLSGRIALTAAEGLRTSAITDFRTARECGDFAQDGELAALVHFYLAESLSADGYLEAALLEFTAFEEQARVLGDQAQDSELITLLRLNRGSAGEAKAGVLERLGRFTDAAEAMSRELTVFPGDARRAARYAALLVKAGKGQEALDVLRSIEPASDEVLDLLADVHRRLGRPEGVVDDLRARLHTNPDDFRLILRLADTWHAFNRPAEAVRDLKSFLSVHPDHSVARMRLAALLVAAGKWHEVVDVCGDGILREPHRAEEYEAVIRGLGGHAEAVSALAGGTSGDSSAVHLYLKGVLAGSLGRKEQAESLLRESRTRDPELVPARVALGQLYLGQFRYAEAVAVAARKDPSVPQEARLERILGTAHERLDDFESAVPHFRAAVQLDPSDMASMMALARIYRRRNDGLSAQRQLRLLVDKDPFHDEAREMLALLYLEEGKLDAATEQIEELKRRSSSPRAKARGEALLNLLRDRDPEAYRRALRQALDQHGADLRMWLALADSFNEFEQDQALEAYRQALTLDPDNEEAALGIVFAQERLLDFESAAVGLAALIERRPNHHAWRLGWSNTSWRRGLLELYFILQDFQAAHRMAWDQAKREDPEEGIRTRYRLAVLDALRAMGQKEAILEHLGAWAESDDEKGVWSLRLAEEFLRQDRPLEAASIYQRRFESKMGDAATRGHLIEALAAAKSHARASQYALDALDEDPENDDSLHQLIVVLARQERLPEAIEMTRNRLLHARDRERFQDLWVRLLMIDKRSSDAVQVTESLLSACATAIRALSGARGGNKDADTSGEERVEYRPNEPFAMPKLHARYESLRLELARQLVAGKLYRDAERRIREWLHEARRPELRFELLMTLAACQRSRGDETQATETLELALSLQPDDVSLNNDVAYGWIDRGVKLDAAERMIRYAVSREPRHMAYLDTYAWLLYKRAKFADARKWLERAHKAGDGKDAVIQEHLGDACWRLGDSAAAIKYWESARDLITALPEEELNADERRVKETVQGKIDDVQAGRPPGVAPLGAESNADEKDKLPSSPTP
jgi:tetratricopeptide (TPR) repeat protein